MDFFRSERFDVRVRDLMNTYHIPGLSLAIIHGEKTASKAFGFACDSSSKPCTTDTLFDIASSSKIMTVVSIALLVEDDTNHPNVKFEAPVSRLLPEDFVMPSREDTKNVTIDDLLGHKTGMAGHDFSDLGVNADQPDTPRSVTRKMRNLQTCAPLRTKYVYSNLMYTVATHLIETETRMSFSNFLETRFFKPLGMSSTSLQPATAKQKGLGERIAMGHMWDAQEGRYSEFPAIDTPEEQGAGSIITSVGDYLKLVKAMMNQEAPITKEVYAGVTKIWTISNPASSDLAPLTSPSFYCAGLGIVYYRGHAILNHNGGVPGFGSRFLWVPSLSFGAVILGNAIGVAFLSNDLWRDLVDNILGECGELSPQSENCNLNTGWLRCLMRSCPKITETQPQEMPLRAYVGHYWNPAYRGMEVQIRDSKLFIDASDRSFPFEITLEHTSEQTNYVAHLGMSKKAGGMPDVLQLREEFAFDNDRVVKLGLELEEDLDELIWFDRVQNEAAEYVFV